MSEAVASEQRQGTRPPEFLRKNPLFERATEVDELLSWEFFGSLAEAQAESGRLIAELDRLALEADLVGEGVELISPELQVPVTKMDPATGVMTNTWGRLESNRFDGQASTHGSFAGFTRVIRAASVEKDEETITAPLFAVQLCYQVALSDAASYPHLAKAIPTAFAPVGNADVLFSSDREQEQASEVLERLMRAQDSDTVALIRSIDKRLSSDHRYSVSVLRNGSYRTGSSSSSDKPYATSTSSSSYFSRPTRYISSLNASPIRSTIDWTSMTS